MRYKCQWSQSLLCISDILSPMQEPEHGEPQQEGDYQRFVLSFINITAQENPVCLVTYSTSFKGDLSVGLCMHFRK